MKLIPREPQATADISSGHTSGRQQARTALIFLGVAALAWWLLGVLGTFVGAHLPDRWERRLGGSMHGLWDNESTGDLSRAQAVLTRLVQDEPLRDLPYRLFMIELEAANAVAFPGGGIGLTPEMLDVVPSEAGLAFVLAHELGHHQHRHMTRRLGRGLLQSLVLSLVLGQDDVGNSAAAVVQVAESGYSRADEREADAYALRLVHRKYGSTAGALEFFRHMVAKEDDPAWQNFIGTHPATADRIAAMEALQRELEQGRKSP